MFAHRRENGHRILPSAGRSGLHEGTIVRWYLPAFRADEARRRAGSGCCRSRILCEEWDPRRESRDGGGHRDVVGVPCDEGVMVLRGRQGLAAARGIFGITRPGQGRMQATVNPALISAFTSVLMTLIWIVYLHLALMQYLRANQPFLVIHHAHENDPKALCLVINMSKEPVHLQCVVADIRGRHGFLRRYVTDYRRITPDDRNVQSRLRQGPIQPGGYLVLGSFEEIMTGARSEPEDIDESAPMPDMLEGIHSLELCVAVLHGPSQFHIGARRSFYVEREDGAMIIRAHSIHTEQLVSRAKRRTVRQWVEGRVEPRNAGAAETELTPQRGNEAAVRRTV